MVLKTSLTGSYPPILDPDTAHEQVCQKDREKVIFQSIERAVHDQIELKIDYLVDGQVRDDIISLFAKKNPAFEGDALPFHLTKEVKPSEEAITLDDYLYAQQLAGSRPLKAHLTGPLTLARFTNPIKSSGYEDRNDPQLIRHLAAMLAKEARILADHGAKIIQVDEPILGTNMEMLPLAFEALEIIFHDLDVTVPALHICNNVSRILEIVLQKAPVKMVSIEGAWLDHERLRHINQAYLKDCQKLIGLGCIRVDSDTIELLPQLQHFLERMVMRLGEESIWALMPNCGMRLMKYPVAHEKLKVMVEAVRAFSRGGSNGY